VSSYNKVLLEPGEQLPDEDDDIDEDHLALARNTQLKEILSESKTGSFEQKLLLDWNDHLANEGVLADRFLGPCFRRWIHRRQDWLRHPMIAQPFQKLLDAAAAKGYINAEWWRACTEAAAEAQEDIAVEGVRSIEQEVELESSAVKCTRDACPCARPFVGVRDRIACANKVRSFLIRLSTRRSLTVDIAVLQSPRLPQIMCLKILQVLSGERHTQDMVLPWLHRGGSSFT
jgi:hypothetical protein